MITNLTLSGIPSIASSSQEERAWRFPPTTDKKNNNNNLEKRKRKKNQCSRKCDYKNSSPGSPSLLVYSAFLLATD